MRMVAIDQEIDSLHSHDIYDLIPRIPDIRILRLGCALHRKFKNGVL